MTVVEGFSGRRILCVGDLMMDRFVSGAVKRISPESPTPILLVEGDSVALGGAGNVARNVVALGGLCTVAGVVGDDADARKLSEATRRSAGLTAHLVVDPSRPTTVKLRLVAQNQNMFRVDRESSEPISRAIEDELIALVSELLPGHDVLVLSDYAKGVMTERLLRKVIARARAAGVPVIVDPKSSDFTRYAGATIITPNVQEVRLATGISPSSDDLAAVAADLARRSAGCEAVLLTRSEKGMTLVRDRGAPVHIQSMAREVYDVVGAGDTVVATLALCLAARVALDEAAVIANAAAGVVVGKRGTAIVSPRELAQALASGPGLSQAAESKVLDLASAVRLADEWKAQGYKVGFTNGCFDILHAGHIKLIDFVRANSQRVIIGLNSDASVRRLKGATRPINTSADRALLLASLSHVDGVVIFDDETPAELICAIMPDVLVKGADYAIDQIVGAEVVLANGGTVLRCDLVPGRSTTKTIERGAMTLPATAAE